MAKSESLVKVLQNVVTLSTELDRLKPLKKEDEERLWKKFRLEWNYNSNHIEGNTLTYQQTELLLIFEKAVGDHEMRELEEMKAHDVAVKLVQEYALDISRELTEGDIREWNKRILVRPFWSNAQTADGQATRKLIQPGEYKKEPNSVLLQNSEMFHYASPEETPAKMKELMEWYRKVSSEKTLHPVEIAAQLHYDFVRIHPFDDSNGRTSRLLMNYVLLKNGYPPVVIKTADKKGYLTALNKADVGDLEAFIEYIAKQLVWSLELSIKAARGESIEELGDLDKEIFVWKKSLNIKENPGKSADTILDIYANSLVNLFESFIKKNQQFNDIFVFNQVSVHADGPIEQLGKDVFLDLGKFFEKVINEYKNKRKEVSTQYDNVWSISYSHQTIRSTEPNKLKVLSDLKVFFQPLHYEIFVDSTSIKSKNYAEFLTEEEVEEISKTAITKVFESAKKMK